ncbi:MAG: hypothetical protein SangKO_031910 [Sandaracinaceae bacterium]
MNATLAAAALLLVALASKRGGGGGDGEGPAPLPGAAELAEYGVTPPAPIDGEPWSYLGFGEAHPSVGKRGHLFRHPAQRGARLFDVDGRRWLALSDAVQLIDGAIAQVREDGTVGATRATPVRVSDGEGGTRLADTERERRRATVLELVWYTVPTSNVPAATAWMNGWSERPPTHLWQTAQGRVRLPVLVWYQPDGTPVRYLAEPRSAARRRFADYPFTIDGAAHRWPGGSFVITDPTRPLTHAAYLALEALGDPVPFGEWVAPPLVGGVPASCWSWDAAERAILWGRSAASERGAAWPWPDCDAWTRSPTFIRRLSSEALAGLGGIGPLVFESRG